MAHNPPMQGIAAALAQQGRFGDTEILHVNRAELEMLEAISPGGLTINPVTGQKEAFLPFLIPMLANAVAPSVAGALGLSGAAASLTPAVLSGLGTWAATGDAEQGLLSGLTSGITGGLGDLFNGAGGAAADAATKGAADAVSSAAAASTDAIAPTFIKQMMQHEGTHALGAGAAEAATKSATKAAADAAGGGIMGWIANNPMMAVAGASALPALFGGSSDEQPASDFEYRRARMPPRNVVPYTNNPSQAADASNYRAGDASMGDSIFRYGQTGGEHMFFDPPPGTQQPILEEPMDGPSDNGSDNTVTIGGQTFEIAPGGLFNVMPRRRAFGGPVTGLRGVASQTPMQAMPAAPMVAGKPAVGPQVLPGAPTLPGKQPMAQVIPGAPQPGLKQPMQPQVLPGGPPPIPGKGGPAPQINPGLPAGPIKPPTIPPQVLPGGPPPAMRNGGRVKRRANGGPIAGPGDGRSDSIPAVGPGGQPYLLSDGEFVVSADVVSALGAGSNRAGSQQLQDMMQRVREKAFGASSPPKKVGRQQLPA